MLLAVPVGYAASQRIFNIHVPVDGEQLSLTSMAQLILGSTLAQALVLGVYIYLLTKARRPHNDNRFKPLSAALIGAGALLLFWPIVNMMGWVAMLTTSLVTGEAVDAIAHVTLALLLESERDVWFFVMIALVVIAAPILEEVLYRGVIQESLGNLGMGSWAAIILASVIFTMMHTTVVPGWGLVSLFVLSLGFGWVYEKTGRLTAPIVMHVLFNAGNVTLALLLH